MTPEQQAALDAATGAERDIAGTTAAPGAPAAPGSDPEAAAKAEKAGRLAELKAENMMMLNLIMSMVEPVLPAAAKYYTAEKLEKIAEAGAAVEAKYNVTIGQLFGKYEPELMLAVAVIGPVSVPLLALVRQALAKRAATVPALVPAAEAPPGTEKEGPKIVPLKGSGDVKKPDK